MSTFQKIYQLKQIISHDFEVKLPKCVYVVENIHRRNSRNVSASVKSPASKDVSSTCINLDICKQNIHITKDMTSLEKRQEQILKQLNELKKQVMSLKENINCTNHGINTSNVIMPDKCPDIVITASPMHPPYYLILLQKLWQKNFHLSVTSHVHSTIQLFPENIHVLIKTLQNFKPINDVPKIDVKLIWKNVGASPELHVSQLPIIGEVNILRYLARIVPNVLTYEKSEKTYQFDSLLDMCYRFVIMKLKTERSVILQNLSKSFNKSSWLGGSEKISVVDIAAYSAIKQVVPLNEINVNLTKWMQKCEAL